MYQNGTNNPRLCTRKNAPLRGAFMIEWKFCDYTTAKNFTRNSAVIT